MMMMKMPEDSLRVIFRQQRSKLVYSVIDVVSTTSFNCVNEYTTHDAV